MMPCECICQIYEAQPEISTVFQTREVLPLPRLLSMIMVVSLPPVCNKAFFTQGLTVSVRDSHNALVTAEPQNTHHVKNLVMLY